LEETSSPQEFLLWLKMQGQVPFEEGGSHWIFSSQYHLVAGEFSQWQAVAMTLLREDALSGQKLYGFRLTGKLTPSSSLDGYKFVDGKGDFHADPLATWFVRDGFGELSLLQDPRPAAAMVNRNLDTYFRRAWSVPGDGRLKPRWLVVAVPTGQGPWPILVMQDGQNLFAPEAPFGGWKVDQALRMLGAKVLVVGIDNTDQRMAEYTHTDDLDFGTATNPSSLGDAYADYVTTEVLAMAEALFPVTPKIGIMGSSLGGLISLWTAGRHPGVYAWAGSLSGTLGWGRLKKNQKTILEHWFEAPPNSGFYYVDSGGALKSGSCPELGSKGWSSPSYQDADNYCANYEFRRKMQPVLAQGLQYHWQENASHNEAAWAARLPLALKSFLATQP
jgi:enterochelin esterase-like enzyme